MNNEYAVPGDDTSRQTERPKTSDLFRRMADQIDKNGSGDFGGAYVIVPPAGGNPVECLVLSSEKDIGQFWGALDFTVSKAKHELDELSRNQQGFGQKR